MPVIVREYDRALDAESVQVEVAVVVSGTGLGLHVTNSPVAGAVEFVRVIVPVKPLMLASVRLNVEVVPTVIVTVEVLAVMVKSFPTAIVLDAPLLVMCVVSPV